MSEAIKSKNCSVSGRKNSHCGRC